MPFLTIRDTFEPYFERADHDEAVTRPKGTRQPDRAGSRGRASGAEGHGKERVDDDRPGDSKPGESRPGSMRPGDSKSEEARVERAGSPYRP